MTETNEHTLRTPHEARIYNEAYETGYANALAAQNRATPVLRGYFCEICIETATDMDMATYPPEEIFEGRLGLRLCRTCTVKHGSGDLSRPLSRRIANCLPHPDDEAIGLFAEAMKIKMALKRAEGRAGWHDKRQCSAEGLTDALLHNAFKGDPVDVANFCMMLHMRGESIVAPRMTPPLKKRPIAFEIVDPENGQRLTWVEQAGISLTLSSLQAAHVERQEEWCPDVKPDLSFRGNELGGECGEAQNVIKKLERERHGWRGSRDTVEHLADELADVIHCTMLVAITAGIDLEKSVVRKFNDISTKNGLSTMLPVVPAYKQGATA